MNDTLANVLPFRVDLNKPIKKKYLDTLMTTGDHEGHRFDIELVRNGEPVAITSGAAVRGYFIKHSGKPDEEDSMVVLEGSFDGNVASIKLDKACYVKSCQFSFVIKLTLGEEITSIFWGDGTVMRSKTDTIEDPTNVVPDLDTLLAKIDAMEAATADGRAAAQEARAAAEEADTARLAIQDDLGHIRDSVAKYNSYNMIDASKLESKTTNGVTFSWDGEKCTITGMAIEDKTTTVALISVYDYIPGNEYHFRYHGTNVYAGIYYNDGTNSIKIKDTYDDTTFVVPDGAVRFFINLYCKRKIDINEVITPILLTSLSNDELKAQIDAEEERARKQTEEVSNRVSLLEVTEKHCDPVGTMMRIAEGYINKAYDPNDSLVYHTQRGLFSENVFDEKGNKAIVCSQFVEACLYGIAYENSRYVQDANKPYAWGMVTDGTGDYSKNCFNDYMTAANLAKYCQNHGWLHKFDQSRPALKPGDILFYSMNVNDPEKWEGIVHCVICLRPGNTVNHVIHSSSGTSRLVGDVEAGVVITRYPNENESGTKWLSYYARIPLESREYTSTLIAQLDGPYTGEYEGMSGEVVKIVFSETQPRGVYTISCKEGGTSKTIYTKIRYEHATKDGINYDANPFGGVVDNVFYAEEPFDSLELRSAPFSKDEPTTINVSDIRVYKGYHPPRLD